MWVLMCIENFFLGISGIFFIGDFLAAGVPMWDAVCVLGFFFLGTLGVGDFLTMMVAVCFIGLFFLLSCFPLLSD